MKKKTMKNVLISSFVLACCTCAAVGLSTADITASAATAVNTTFAMEAGASLKLMQGDNGIRFKVKMDATTAENITSDDNVSLHFAIMPIKMYEAVTAGTDGYTKGAYETADCTKISVDEEKLYVSGEYTYANGVVNQLLDENRKTNYVAVAYIDNNGIYEYATVDATQTLGKAYDLANSTLMEEGYTQDVLSYYDWLGTADYPVVLVDDTVASKYVAYSATNDALKGLTVQYADNVTADLSSLTNATGVKIVTYYAADTTTVLKREIVAGTQATQAPTLATGTVEANGWKSTMTGNWADAEGTVNALNDITQSINLYPECTKVRYADVTFTCEISGKEDTATQRFYQGGDPVAVPAGFTLPADSISESDEYFHKRVWTLDGNEVASFAAIDESTEAALTYKVKFVNDTTAPRGIGTTEAFDNAAHLNVNSATDVRGSYNFATSANVSIAVDDQALKATYTQSSSYTYLGVKIKHVEAGQRYVIGFDAASSIGANNYAVWVSPDGFVKDTNRYGNSAVSEREFAGNGTLLSQVKANTGSGYLFSFTAGNVTAANRMDLHIRKNKNTATDTLTIDNFFCMKYEDYFNADFYAEHFGGQVSKYYVQSKTACTFVLHDVAGQEGFQLTSNDTSTNGIALNIGAVKVGDTVTVSFKTTETDKNNWALGLNNNNTYTSGSSAIGGGSFALPTITNGAVTKTYTITAAADAAWFVIRKQAASSGKSAIFYDFNVTITPAA